jgi:hypothetical protein
MATAMQIVHGMAGGFGIALPESLAQQLHALRPLFESMGFSFYLGGGTTFVETWMWIAIAAIIAFAFPNTQEITRRFEPALDFAHAHDPSVPRIARILTWRPSRRWAIAIALLALTSILSLNRPAEFLYFQF